MFRFRTVQTVLTVSMTVGIKHVNDKEVNVRFSMKVDIDLWKELAAFTPFFGAGCNNWAEIAENLTIIHKGIFLDGRRCRERARSRGQLFAVLFSRQMTVKNCTGAYIKQYFTTIFYRVHAYNKWTLIEQFYSLCLTIYFCSVSKHLLLLQSYASNYFFFIFIFLNMELNRNMAKRWFEFPKKCSIMPFTLKR